MIRASLAFGRHQVLHICYESGFVSPAANTNKALYFDQQPFRTIKMGRSDKENREPKDVYNHQALNLLKTTFPKISFFAMQRVLKSVHFSFTAAYNILDQINRLFPEENSAMNICLHYGVRMPVRIFLKTLRGKEPFRLDNTMLLAEIQEIPFFNQKENIRVVLIADDQEDDTSVDDKAAVECGCCFGVYHSSEMSQCSAKCGHYVCNGCIYRYVSEQLDGKDSVVFQCIVQENCKSLYMEAMLDQVLSPRLKERVGSRLVQKEAEKAGYITW
jgi:hypothetical protein